MLPDVDPELPELSRLALASAAPGDRGSFAVLLAFDAALARIAAQAREPMLAQIRYAWWRDQIATPGDTAHPDPLLALVARMAESQWAGWNGLVDGWEAVVLADPIDTALLNQFADGRAGAFAAVASSLAIAYDPAALRAAARLWALADFAAHCGDGAGRSSAMALARAEVLRQVRLPRRLRPLAVLAGLARRSLKRNGAPLLGDRLSPFVAARIALSGF